MERIPKGIYNPEFREQAVRLYEIDKLTLPEIARRLSLPQGTLKGWVYASRRGKLGEMGRPARKKPPTKDLAQSKGISENEQLLPTSESVYPLKDRLQEQNYRGELALIKLK